MSHPLVTFGIVNCNRLHYLKSCFESLIRCTADYPNREVIVIDNASVEEGTQEYLSQIEGISSVPVRVIRQETRDPSNEFAKALNIIVRESKGDFVCPLQGDMQFTAEGKWLHEYVKFLTENPQVGCILLDAQRTVTHASHAMRMSPPMGDKFKFVFDWQRPPISGAADVMYARKVIETVYPWYEKNEAHEGGQDSETEMLRRVEAYMRESGVAFSCAVPIVPVSVAIYTDARGTNARVRGNRRYGDYWPPKEDCRYYEIHPLDQLIEKFGDRTIPVGIEEVAEPVGWKAPIDSGGSWLKNPIRPESAQPSDFVDLVAQANTEVSEDEDYLSEWLDD